MFVHQNPFWMFSCVLALNVDTRTRAIKALSPSNKNDCVNARWELELGSKRMDLPANGPRG